MRSPRPRLVSQRLRLRILSATLALTMLPACGSTADSSHGNASRPKKILAVVMGGNNSCAHGSHSPGAVSMLPRVRQLRERLRAAQGVTTDFIVVCWTLSRQLYMAPSAEPDSGEHVEAPELASRLAAIQAAAPSIYTLFIGHSYGGWLAMKTILRLPFAVDLLATIDPISPVKCQLRNLRGCDTAPTDIPPPDYDRLQERSRNWLNFFATRAPLLHAGRITAANANHAIPTSHAQIDNAAEVWRLTEAAVDRGIAADSEAPPALTLGAGL